MSVPAGGHSQTIREAINEVRACINPRPATGSLAYDSLDLIVAALVALEARADGWVQHDTKAYQAATTRAMNRADAAEAELVRVTAAIEPFVSAFDFFVGDTDNVYQAHVAVTGAQLRAARALLGGGMCPPREPGKEGTA